MLVFEDLHWADEGLLDFVDQLVDWAVGVPMLVVCTARPELLDAPAGLGRRQAERVDGLALAARPTTRRRELVHALLEQPVLAGGASGDAARARRRQSALRGGVRAHGRRSSARRRAPLPESVQGIIAARLDALAARGEAAAPGRRRGRQGLLARGGRGDRRPRPSAAEEALHSLERKEFVRRERSVFGRRTGAVRFRHALVRDVAYGQIPRAARAEKHLAAAEWIESLGRPEDHAELIAHHYLSALEFSSAAGKELPEVADRARLALRAAGARKLSLYSFAQRRLALRVRAGPAAGRRP